jgi:methyl-accepting chemotaxis protein
MIKDIWVNTRGRFLGLSIGWTLSIILLLGLVPSIVMGRYFVTSQQQGIEIADHELEGMELLREIQPIGHFIAAPPLDQAEKQTAAKKFLQQFRQAMAHGHHAENFAVQTHAKRLEAHLSLLAQGNDVDARSTFDALVKRIGDQSGLILDPELDSYYMMDMLVIKSARIVRAIDELERAYPKTNSTQDPLFLILRHRLVDSTRDFKETFDFAVAGNDSGHLQNSKVPETINSVIVAANKLIAAKEVGADTQPLRRALAKNWLTASHAFDSLLNARKDRLQTELITGLAVSAFTCLIVLLVAGGLILALLQGLRSISKRLADLADGDYVSEVPGTEFTNDVGVIANALQSFIDLSGQMEHQRAEAKAQLEKTVAEIRCENDKLLSEALEQQAKSSELERQMVTRLAGELEQRVAGLFAGSKAAVHQMKNEAAAMVDNSDMIQRQSSTAGEAANEIRLTVESLAPVIETVSRKLNAYTHSLGDAQTLAGDALSRVDDANDKILELNQATQHTSQMLAVITSVAHKTNLLALNATIEAARVGEAGKGFAVVADEVKALANMTRDAAREIATQISAMDSANIAVSSAFEMVLEVVNTLAERSISVATGMVDQAATINQVESSITNATGDLSKMMGSINQAQQSAQAAIVRSQEVMSASENVATNFGQLDGTVRDFLDNVQNTQKNAA